MDLSVSNNFPDSLSALRQARIARAYVAPVQTPVSENAEPANLPAAITKPAAGDTSGTRLVNEAREDIAEGFRKTSTFERTDGRQFTRVEEFTLTQQGARRSVIQQNPSGSITRYEEILDREGSGNFRRTQRFQDEGGDVATQITPDFKVTDPFVLTRGASAASNAMLSPFASYRGTQLDLRA